VNYYKKLLTKNMNNDNIMVEMVVDKIGGTLKPRVGNYSKGLPN
jgi:hypothetical protein